VADRKGEPLDPGSPYMSLGPNPPGPATVISTLARTLDRPLALAWRFEAHDQVGSGDFGLGDDARQVVEALLQSDPDSQGGDARWTTRIARFVGCEFALAAPAETDAHHVDGLAELLATLLHALVDQERFAFVLDNSADIIAVMRADGTAEYATPSVERVLGWPPGHFETSSAFDLLHPDDLDGVVSSVDLALTEPGERYSGRFRVRHQNGSWVWVDGRVSIAPGRSDVALFSARDVTRQVDAERQASEEQTRALTVLDASPQPIAIHQNGHLVFVNRSAMALLGATEAAELIGQPMLRFTTASPQVIKARFDAIDRGEMIGPNIVTLRRIDGSLVDVELTGIPTTWDGLQAVQIIAVDLSERRRMEAMLQHASLHDPLTGLPNRRLLADRLDRCLSRARRSGDHAAILFCDLDQFKVINDALGHSVGDQVLIEIARRLRLATRETDTVARFGGDEFVVLTEDLADDAAIERLAERVCAVVRDPFVVSGHTMHLTFSTGVVRITGSEALDELLSWADSAMYAAKQAGRDRWVLFDETLRTRASDRLRIESALRASLDSGSGLSIHTQPEVDLATRQIVGYEALVRWDGPDGSGLSPDEFLPVAADAGLMPAVGSFVLARSIEFAIMLPPSAKQFVAVNASAEELEHPNFARQVKALLDAAEMDGSGLCLELTEHSIIRDPAGTAAVLGPLRDRGVTIAIDDFGTGYSSLAYLARFHPDFLKIDRSFTAGVLDQPTQRSIVEAVLHLAASLDITTIAEGVETEAQAQVLSELGCNLAQGWHFGRAAPPGTWI
jgi:diguanylate cyclase (GGDEF)-like protein/PAS domain S-box-containing protein